MSDVEMEDGDTSEDSGDSSEDSWDSEEHNEGSSSDNSSSDNPPEPSSDSGGDTSSSGEDDEMGDAHGVWMPILGEDAGPIPIPFTAVPGIKHPPPQTGEPVDFFNLFFTPAIIDKVVTETVQYANQWIAAHQDYLREKRHSSVHQWSKRAVTVEEFRAFLGLTINMGLIRKTTLASYWNTANRSQATPWFNEHFTRDRFLLLLKFLHFNNNANQPPPGDSAYKLYKIEPIVTHFNRMFLFHYHPGMDVSIDESMVGFKGKTPHLRQFMPQKRHARFGIKLWCLCDSRNGYTSCFEVYKGKDVAAPVDPRGSTHALVMRLMTNGNLLQRGHHLGIDNFFSSPDLFLELYQQGTTASGTVRCNRKGLPKQAIKKKLKNQETEERRKGNLLCVAYQDGNKKPILLSTAAAAGFQDDVTSRGQPVRRPRVVSKYNKSMGGVDLSDARLYKYLSERRTMKWTNKVVFSILGRAVLNSYILYDLHTNQPKLSRYQYMVQLVESLTDGYYPPKSPARRRTRRQIRRDANLPVPAAPPAQPQPGPAAVPAGNHWPRKLPGGKKRNCVAPVHPRRKRTSYECRSCDVGLCPECFAIYH
ncbi:piggyBac transposable element-derived protein 4-like [Branchiostoma lanceolatum]|uniref:piggyBac transposable element-derived protein 4-like n=1 Tax=Branchiostoma lanceolatum TaxID=7740 RepID=UPI003456AF09